MEGEAAKGLELLAGRTSADTMEVKLPGNRVALRITDAQTMPKLDFQGDDPSSLKLTCRIEASLVEYEKELGREELKQLCTAVECRIRARLHETLNHLREWQTDCTGMGARAALAHPGKWQAVQKEWPWWFGWLEPELQVNVAIHD